MKIDKIQLGGIYMFITLNLFILITGESPYQKILCTISLVIFLLILKSHKIKNNIGYIIIYKIN